MNLCTDQLAMLIAAPGQLHSVSHLAAREDSSAMAREAAAYAVNHGQAEEIFLMKPDLVLTGAFNTRTTVALLRRLGTRVEEFAPEMSFADISANIARMGALLGRKEQADALIAALDERLAGYAVTDGAESRPLAALAYANSYTAGGGTLANDAVERAGLANLGERLGYRGMVRLPLEVLVMHAPELIIGGERQADDPARAYDALRHPALRYIFRDGAPVVVPDKYWICGTPFITEALRILADAAAGGTGRPR
jgi:iron complex transport system substrate-binding protein